eukprot:1738769-Rhodomonas_salina.1
MNCTALHCTALHFTALNFERNGTERQCEVGVCKGKNLADKRASIKGRDQVSSSARRSQTQADAACATSGSNRACIIRVGRVRSLLQSFAVLPVLVFGSLCLDSLLVVFLPALRNPRHSTALETQLALRTSELASDSAVDAPDSFDGRDVRSRDGRDMKRELKAAGY